MMNYLQCDEEYKNIVESIMSNEEFVSSMDNIRHHDSTRLNHMLKVSYKSYKIAKMLKLDYAEVARAGLLHDYYLYDWHDRKPEHRFHGFMHPKRALKNALEKYPDLTENEKDMIVRHMFPLTVIPPKTKAGWLICFYDKVAAISDYFGKNRWKTGKEKLVKI